MLTVRLLGTPHFSTPAGAIQLMRRQPVALLAVLALNPEPVGRDQLAFLFWPDIDQETARQRLRRTLSQLRQALTPAGTDLIQTNQDYVSLSDAVWVDSREFERLVRQQALERAAQLYGGPLLAGFHLNEANEFEQWLVSGRERLERQYRHLLAQLVSQYQAAGRWPEAIPFAEKQLALDHLLEESHLSLMRLYANTGRREEALRQYEQCRHILTHELGLEPLPQTTQLAAAIRQGTYPPPQPITFRPKLPAQPNQLIGRQQEISDLNQLLSRPDLRLLTLSGTGGTGKTRLALHLAHQWQTAFADGLFFIDLSAINDSALVIPTINRLLQLSESGGQSPLNHLIAYLRPRQTLLVLDNFEQLLPATASLAELLANAPQLKLLVTSRALLQIYGEWEYAVPPLALPAPTQAQQPAKQEPAHSPAVTLFVERCQAAKAHFQLTAENGPVVAEICARLDGLPLAIELAAARIKLFSPQAMLARLKEGVGLHWLAHKTVDRPERQQTMWQAIDWSYALLNSAEQSLLATLSIFQGGWSVAAAATVSQLGDEGLLLTLLQALLDQSLIRPEQERFTMLATIQAYAASQLAATGQKTEIANRQAAYFLQLVSQPGQITIADLENVRTAWHWAVQHQLDSLLTQALDGFYQLFESHSWFAAGEEAFASAVQARPDNDHPLTARLLARQGSFCYRLGRYAEAQSCLQYSLELLTDQPVDRAFCLNGLGEVAYLGGDYGAARLVFEQSLELYRAAGRHYEMAAVYNNLGNAIASEESNPFTQSAGYYQQASQYGQQSANLPQVARALMNLGTIAHENQDYRLASQRYRQAITLCKQTGDRRIWGIALTNLSEATFQLHDYQEAKALAEASLRLKREIGDQRGLSYVYNVLGGIYQAMGDPAGARAAFRESLRMAYQIQAWPAAMSVMFSIAEEFMGQENWLPAGELLQFISNHPAGEQHIRQAAQQALCQLPPPPHPVQPKSLDEIINYCLDQL